MVMNYKLVAQSEWILRDISVSILPIGARIIRQEVGDVAEVCRYL
jgi:hypothetical protein